MKKFIQVDTLNSTFSLVQEIKEFSTKMINTGNFLFKQLDNFRKEKINTFKVISNNSIIQTKISISIN